MDKEVEEKTPFDHLTATINDYTLAGAYRLGFKHARSKLSEGEPPLLNDEETAEKLHNTPGTKLKFESKLTDQDMTAFKDEMRIQLKAIARAQRDSDIKWRKGE